MIRLPNFLIIGASKAGTTSLYEYLRSHPQVFMPAYKELRFFDAPPLGEVRPPETTKPAPQPVRGGVTELPGRNWTHPGTTWRLGIAWYEQQFAGAGDALAAGEASPSYTLWPQRPGVPARIRDVIPDARLIYLMRDPVERIRSHYLHTQSLMLNARVGRTRPYYSMGQAGDPIEKVVLAHSMYLDASRYATQVDQYLRHFPREQLLLLQSERLRADPAATMRRVCEFIGVDPSLPMPALHQRFHVSSEKRAPRAWARRLGPAVSALRRFAPERARTAGRRLMRGADTPTTEISPAFRALLSEVLREEVARIRPYMDGDFDGWGIA